MTGTPTPSRYTHTHTHTHSHTCLRKTTTTHTHTFWKKRDRKRLLPSGGAFHPSVSDYRAHSDVSGARAVLCCLVETMRGHLKLCHRNPANSNSLPLGAALVQQHPYIRMQMTEYTALVSKVTHARHEIQQCRFEYGEWSESGLFLSSRSNGAIGIYFPMWRKRKRKKK